MGYIATYTLSPIDDPLHKKDCWSCRTLCRSYFIIPNSMYYTHEIFRIVQIIYFRNESFFSSCCWLAALLDGECATRWILSKGGLCKVGEDDVPIAYSILYLTEYSCLGDISSYPTLSILSHPYQAHAHTLCRRERVGEMADNNNTTYTYSANILHESRSREFFAVNSRYPWSMFYYIGWAQNECFVAGRRRGRSSFVLLSQSVCSVVLLAKCLRHHHQHRGIHKFM